MRKWELAVAVEVWRREAFSATVLTASWTVALDTA